jgi:hyperosmotically inducible periplasmic protein
LNNPNSFAKRAWIAVITATLAGMLVLAGCNKTTEHADVKYAVDTAMTQAGLGVVKVSQDRDKGVLTLTGDVPSADQKAQAEQLAKQAAPDYAVSNEIGIRPIGQGDQAKAVDNKLDDGIEDNYKAAIKAHKDLDDQSISCKAKNGTLVLSGSVKTPAQKSEATKLAKSIPNVKEVVNELEVKPSKSSTAG